MERNDDIEEVLERFDCNPKWRGRYWLIRCPKHEDRSPSAQCFPDGWINCMAGCGRFHIDSIAGRKVNVQNSNGNYEHKKEEEIKRGDFTNLWADLDPLPNDLDVKGIDGKTLNKLGWRWYPGGNGYYKGIFIPYFNMDRTKVPFFQIRHLEGDRRFTFAKDITPILWGFDVLPKIKDELCFTEGCVTPDTEVLTEGGWVRFSDYGGEQVLIYDREKNVSKFEKPKKIIKHENSGEAYHLQSRFVDLVVSPGHRITGETMTGKYCEYLGVERIQCGCMRLKKAAEVASDSTGLDLTDDEIRLLVAIQADGCLRSNSKTQRVGERRIYFHLKKDRKCERLEKLIKGYKMHHGIGADGYHNILFTLPEHIPYTKTFDFRWIHQMSQHQRLVFLRELPYWDGNFVKGRTMTEYNTTDEHNADFVQALAVCSGVASTKRLKVKAGPKNILTRVSICKDSYKVTVLWGKDDTTISNQNKTETRYGGTMYCVQVSTGEFFVRRNGHIVVTGNCRDAAILRSIGVPAVALPSASSGKIMKGLEKYCNDNKIRMVAICDKDEAGEGLLKTLQSPYTDLRSPVGKDVGDFLAERGIEALRAFYAPLQISQELI